MKHLFLKLKLKFFKGRFQDASLTPLTVFFFQTKGGESECRYGLFDFEYDHQCQGTTDTSKKQKLFLMSW